MSFLGIEAAKAPAGMRSRRFLAFLLDACVVAALSFLLYRFTGQPDFFAVRDAMDAMDAAGGQDAALTAAFVSAFNKAYGLLMLLALCYEILLQLVTNGSTVGKLVMGLQVVPVNSSRGRPLQYLLLCVRSTVKLASLYLFQGIPFIICCLTIFTNSECRTGFDMAVKCRTVPRAKKQGTNS